MRIIEAVSKPGKTYNEDIIDYGNNYILLMDGATGLTNNHIKTHPSDAVWFVEETAKFIKENISEYQDLLQLLDNLINHLNKSYYEIVKQEVTRIDMPSAGMILVREKNHDIELLMLGDCTTIIEYQSLKLEVLHDDRVSKLDNGVIEKMKQIASQKNIPLYSTREYVLDDLIINRNKKNTEGGYSVLGFEHVKRDNLIYREFKKTDIKSIAIFSDGIAEYYETLLLAKDGNEFYSFLKTKGVNRIVDEIRERQNLDYNCDNYPRLKPKDDASIAIIEF